MSSWVAARTVKVWPGWLLMDSSQASMRPVGAAGRRRRRASPIMPRPPSTSSAPKPISAREATSAADGPVEDGRDVPGLLGGPDDWLEGVTAAAGGSATE